MCSTCGGHTDPTDATQSANESRILASGNRLIAATKPPSNATEVAMDFTQNEPTPITPELPTDQMGMTDREASDYANKVFYQAKPERTKRPRNKRK